MECLLRLSDGLYLDFGKLTFILFYSLFVSEYEIDALIISLDAFFEAPG